MDLRDTIVTADVMNCQKDTVEVITSQKGDYVLALKGNQPLFYEEVRSYFDKETMVGLKKKSYSRDVTIFPLWRMHGGMGFYSHVPRRT